MLGREGQRKVHWARHLQRDLSTSACPSRCVAFSRSIHLPESLWWNYLDRTSSRAGIPFSIQIFSLPQHFRSETKKSCKSWAPWSTWSFHVAAHVHGWNHSVQLSGLVRSQRKGAIFLQITQLLQFALENLFSERILKWFYAAWFPGLIFSFS